MYKPPTIANADAIRNEWSKKLRGAFAMERAGSYGLLFGWFITFYA
jgi:hypothetical protein